MEFQGVFRVCVFRVCVFRVFSGCFLLCPFRANKHKEFRRDTPWCASRLSRGHVPSVPRTFCPFSIDLHINQAQMSQVSLGRPEFVPGTPPGHPTAKFLYVTFLYRFFSFPNYFQIIFGNSCSAITEPICLWN